MVGGEGDVVGGERGRRSKTSCKVPRGKREWHVSRARGVAGVYFELGARAVHSVNFFVGLRIVSWAGSDCV